MRRARFCVFVVATLIGVSVAAEENAPGLAALRTRRDAVIEEVQVLERRLETLNSDYTTRLTSEAEYQSRLRALAAEKAKQPADPDKIANIQNAVDYYEEKLRNGNDSRRLKAEIDALQNDLVKKRNDREKAERDLSSKLDIEGNEKAFRLKIAAGFAFLLLFVFCSVLFAILRNAEFRTRFLSGEGLIILVLVFLLLTTVALVGITGIIESKDLSGLIGAIAGYLLARVEKKGEKGEKGGGEVKN